MDVDIDIIRACIKDDRKAVEHLYEYCFHLLMPACFRYHNNEEDARSSLNICFVKIIGGLKDVKLEKFNFNAWAKRVMNNTLIDEYRKKKKHQDRQMSTDNERELDFFSEGSENEAESNFEEAHILSVIAELPEVSQQVFNLFVIEGYSHKEIAEQLNFAEGTSKWHLSTARKMLRDKLEMLENKYKRMVI
jgi:RNA polymerase sigma factor (sigma-70 family)